MSVFILQRQRLTQTVHTTSPESSPSGLTSGGSGLQGIGKILAKWYIILGIRHEKSFCMRSCVLFFFFLFWSSRSFAALTCGGNELGSCPAGQESTNTFCQITKVEIDGITSVANGAGAGVTVLKRTSFSHYPVGFTHNGGKGMNYTATLDVQAPDATTTLTESTCKGSLTVFFGSSGEKNINVSVTQKEWNRTLPSTTPLRVIYDKTPPVLTITRVWEAASENGSGLEYSTGKTYYTSTDLTVNVRVADQAPAQAPEKLSVQVVEGLSEKPAPQPLTGGTSPGQKSIVLGVSGKPEGEYLLRLAAIDSLTEKFEDGSDANYSDTKLVRVVYDTTAPTLLSIELVRTDAETNRQIVQNLPGAFIPAGTVRIRAKFSESLKQPPTLQIEQLGNDTGTPPQPYAAVVDMELFRADPTTVEYEFAPRVAPDQIGPANFTFSGGFDLAGVPLDTEGGVLANGGTVQNAVIIDTIPPDLSRIDPENPGDMQSVPANGKRLGQADFPSEILIIVKDYNISENTVNADETLLRRTDFASGVDFTKVLEGGATDTGTVKGIQVELLDPDQKVLNGTLVTQPPNGLVYLLPPVSQLFPGLKGIAKEGTYTVRVNLIDKVGNTSLESFNFIVDNTPISGSTIKVSLEPAPQSGAQFTPDEGNPLLVNPISGVSIPDNPALIDLSKLDSVMNLSSFKVCSTDPSFDLTRSTVYLKARLNGPDTIAKTLVASATANLSDTENACKTSGSIVVTVSPNQGSVFLSLSNFPNPSAAGPSTPPGSRDPRFGQLDGPYIVEVIAVDNAGNKSDPIRKEFLLDTTQPYTEDVFPKAHGKVNSPLRHVSAVLKDPHPPRTHTFNTVGHINFGSGIDVDRSSLKVKIEVPYRENKLGTEIFDSSRYVRTKLNFSHVPNAIDPTLPGYNPKDDAYRVLIEFTNKSTVVESLPTNGDVDGIYALEVVPVDNAGNSVAPAASGSEAKGWKAYPEGAADAPKEILQKFYFLLDSVAPRLTVDGEPSEIKVNSREFTLSGKTRDLSAKQDQTQGGAGIDRVEFDVVYMTEDGEIVQGVEAGQNTKAKKNPILSGIKAELSAIQKDSSNPYTSSTRPMNPSSYPNIALEERTWKITGNLPPADELIGAGENQTGKAAHYWLRIFSYDLAGNKTERKIKIFLQLSPMMAATLISPYANQKLKSNLVRFEWSKVENAVSYTLYVSEPGGGTTTQLVDPNGTENPWTQKLYSPQGEYQWWVVARDSVGNVGEESVHNKFYIDRLAPSINLLTWLDLSPDSQGKLTLGQFRMQIQFSEQLNKAPQVYYWPYLASIPPQLITTVQFGGMVWEGRATIPQTATASWDGVAVIEVKDARDFAGNEMDVNRSYSFEIDTGPSWGVKFFENPVYRSELVLVLKASERLSGNPTLFSPYGFSIQNDNLVKVGDQSWAVNLRLDTVRNEQTGSVQITATDLLGNTITRAVNFPIKKATVATPTILQTSRMKVEIPPGSLKEGEIISILESSGDTTEENLEKIGVKASLSKLPTELEEVLDLGLLWPADLSLSSPATVVLTGIHLDKSQGLFLLGEGVPRFLGTSVSGFEISSFGRILVYEDTQSPRIEVEEAKGDVIELPSGNSQIKVRVSDFGSGLDLSSFKVRTGTQNWDISPSAEDGVYLFSPSSSLARGRQEIEIEAKDFIGNLSRQLFSLQVTGPLRFSGRIYPNPANRYSRLRYELSRSVKEVSVRIFDSAGMLVFRTDSVEDPSLSLSSGNHEWNWNLENLSGTPVSNGVYFLRIRIVGTGGEILKDDLKLAVIR